MTTPTGAELQQQFEAEQKFQDRAKLVDDAIKRRHGEATFQAVTHALNREAQQGKDVGGTMRQAVFMDTPDIIADRIVEACVLRNEQISDEDWHRVRKAQRDASTNRPWSPKRDKA